jgi:uracil-DNA glycosylase family 4
LAHEEWRCAGCPRASEPPGVDRDDVRGKWAGPRGPVDATVVCLGQAPGKDELMEGRAFVGATGRVTTHALAYAGIDDSRIRYINVCNCYPLGAQDKLTPEQIVVCRSRLEEDLLSATACRILVPLGADALRAVTGYSGAKQGIVQWRGYLIPRARVNGEVKYTVERKRKTFPLVLPPKADLILPTVHPAYVIRSGFTRAPYLQCDFQRVRRALDGKLLVTNPKAKEGDFASLCMAAPLDSPIGFDLEVKKGPDGNWSDDIERAGIMVSLQDGYHCASAPWTKKVKNALEYALTSNPDRWLIAHNMSADVRWLRLTGIEIKGRWHCTMAGFQLLQPDLEKALNTVASCLMDLERWKHERSGTPTRKRRIVKKVKGETDEAYESRVQAAGLEQLDLFRDARKERNAREHTYNMKDAYYLGPIFEAEIAAMRRTKQYGLFCDTISPAMPVLFEMQWRGLRVDPTVRADFLKRFTKQRDAARRVWDEVAAIDPGSWQELHALLYEEWKLPKKYKKKTTRNEEGVEEGESVTADKEALQDLLLELDDSHPEKRRALKSLLAWRKHQKRASTYVAMDEIIHPAYVPVGKDEGEHGQKFTFSAATGRITARDPNIQAWEKPLRKLFIPHREGDVFLASDYVQQELRIQAFLAQDKALMEAVLSGDVHAYHMEVFKVDRTRAKNAVYGSIFRGGAKAIQHQFKQYGFRVELAEIMDIQREVRSRYYKTFKWQDAYIADVVAKGYAIGVAGRRRYFFAPKHQINQICNYPIQWAGAFMLWRVLPTLYTEAKKFWGSLAAAIHDETLFEFKEDMAERAAVSIKHIMEQPVPEIAPDFWCPVEVKVGWNWAAKTNLNLTGMEKRKVA